MVYFQHSALDGTFHALADATRRAILARLAEVPDAPAGDLARPFAMSLPAVLKHLAVLEAAGLVVREKRGRTVRCRLVPEPMKAAMAWLSAYERFWADRLDALAEYLEGPEWDAQTERSATSSPARQEAEPVKSGRASRSAASSTRPRSGSSRRGPNRRT
jgi:DNA-binding transcriptional ArsR family regulator